VVVTESLREASDAVRAYLAGEAFGDAGRTVVIEEGMRGPELSVLVVCNGDPGAAIPLAPAQDFKRALDGDGGPNTGGMGAYSPVPVAGPELVEEVMETSVLPTLHALARDGIDYRGILYAGLMLTADGPKILEYNVRFGDPECQVVVPRLSSDLGALLLAAATGNGPLDARFADDACVSVVLAAQGYPGAPRGGDVISGLDDAAAIPGVTVFHGGTARDQSGAIVTAGGRILDVTTTGSDLTQARARAYDAAGCITWPGVQYRRDIAAAQ
jgi:phosphoribosylamine---glycine ligase